MDVWSIGCVLSEAAIWVVQGFPGLQEYRRRRKMETEHIPLLKDCDCFHDGEKPLATVTNLHRTLTDDCRTSDHVTAAALNSIINETLVASDKRLPARILYSRSQEIIVKAEAKLGKSVANRSSSGTHSRSGSRDIIYDRPKTPPQVPDGYYQPRPRTPQHLDSIATNHRYVSSPESLTSRNTENDQSNYDLTPSIRTIPKRSRPIPRVNVNQGYKKMQRESFDNFTNGNRDPFLELGPSEREYMHDESSGTIGNLVSSSGNGLRHPSLGSPRGQWPRAAIGPFKEEFCSHGRDIMHTQLASPSAQEFGKNVPGESQMTQQRLDDTHSSIHKEQSPDSLSPGRYQDILPRETSSMIPTRTPPPYLSVADAKKWKTEKKNGKRPTLPNANLLDSLNDRDHVSHIVTRQNMTYSLIHKVFLIDNSSSMRAHRRDVRDLFDLLAYMVKEKDPDGIELHTTISNKAKSSKNVGPLSRSLLDKQFEGDSNIRLELGNILQSYEARLKGTETTRFRGRRKKAKDLNLYILTDGVWQPESDPTEMISDIVETLKEHKVYSEKFGIQFIRFGNDQNAIDRLGRLDSGLNLPM